MTRSSEYGRLDLLPGDLYRAVSRGEVEALGWEDSRALDADTLARFRNLPGDVLDWTDIPAHDLATYDDDTDAVRILSQMIRRYSGQASEGFVLWGTLAMPTVRMPAAALVQHLPGIVEAGPHFWIHIRPENYIIEFLTDGQITAGPVPAAPTHMS